MLKALTKRRIFLTTMAASATTAAIAAPIGAVLASKQQTTSSEVTLNKNASTQELADRMSQYYYTRRMSFADYSVANYLLYHPVYGAVNQITNIDRSIDVKASTRDNIVYTRPDLVANFESSLRGYYINTKEENGKSQRYFYHTRLFFGNDTAQKTNAQYGTQQMAHSTRGNTLRGAVVVVFRALTFELLDTPSSDIEVVAFEDLHRVVPNYFATYESWRDKYEAFDITQVKLRGHASFITLDIGNQVLPEDTRLSFIINLAPFFTQEMPFISLRGFFNQTYRFYTPQDYASLRVRLVSPNHQSEITTVKEHQIGWSHVDLTPLPL